MKVYYDTKCNFCKLNMKPFKNNKFITFCDAKSNKTIIVEKDGKKYTKSDAIIELLKTKSKLYIVLYICPKIIRDFLYDIIAKNRKKLSRK